LENFSTNKPKAWRARVSEVAERRTFAGHVTVHLHDQKREFFHQSGQSLAQNLRSSSVCAMVTGNARWRTPYAWNLPAD
jgi:hypothetical protein